MTAVAAAVVAAVVAAVTVVNYVDKRYSSVMTVTTQ